MTRDNMLINCSMRIEEQNEYNLVHQFHPTDRLSSLLKIVETSRLPMHTFQFCCWIEMVNLALITCNHAQPITSGSSLVLFSQLQQILIQQSPCSQVRKWGTQQAATLHFQLLTQNRTDRQFWNIQSLNKLLNNDVTISNYSCNWIHHLLGATAQ